MTKWVLFWLFFLNQNRKNIEAHMFWWHYKSPYRVEDPSKPWPIILWLQGGPVSFYLLLFVFYTFVVYWSLMFSIIWFWWEQGASGVGIGNFQEVGPLDTFLKPRNSTWLKKADLLFVVSIFFISLPSILLLFFIYFKIYN